MKLRLAPRWPKDVTITRFALAVLGTAAAASCLGVLAVELSELVGLLDGSVGKGHGQTGTAVGVFLFLWLLGGLYMLPFCLALSFVAGTVATVLPVSDRSCMYVGAGLGCAVGITLVLMATQMQHMDGSLHNPLLATLTCLLAYTYVGYICTGIFLRFRRQGAPGTHVPVTRFVE